jgi:hypothetical protein
MKMIMMFTNSWAPSDKFSSGHPCGRWSVRITLLWGLLMSWSAAVGHGLLPVDRNAVPFSCWAGNPNLQACVWPSIYCSVSVSTKHQGEENIHHVVGECESQTRLLYSYLPSPLPTLQEGECFWVLTALPLIWI